MTLSLLVGLLYSLTILLSGLLRFIIYKVTLGYFGKLIPFMYFLLGISFGLGDDKISYWPGYILGMLISITISVLSFREKFDYYSDESPITYRTTISISSSGFIFGGIIGMVISLF
ncbi:hypothetical protein VR611_02105 [Aquirufa nivalisilvae]